MGNDTATATIEGVVKAELRRAAHRAQAVDKGLYCPKLERLLLCGAAELGLSGNLAKVVAAIERGGAGGGSVDYDGAMVERLNRSPRLAQQLRKLEEAFARLSAKHQALALAHYCGTPRADASIRQHFGNGPDVEAQQGSLAGVVLYRWRLKRTRERDRRGDSSTAKLDAELAPIRARLQRCWDELAARTAAEPPPAPQLERPTRPEEPLKPDVPFVLSKRARREELAPWRAARAAYREQLVPYRAARDAYQAAADQHCAVVEGWVAGTQYRLAELRAEVRSLEDEQARLCLLQATVAATDHVDDEQALVQLCRSGKLDAAAHLAPAETDVRALHRAWFIACRSASKAAAQAWLESEQPAEAAAG